MGKLRSRKLGNLCKDTKRWNLLVGIHVLAPALLSPLPHTVCQVSFLLFTAGRSCRMIALLRTLVPGLCAPSYLFARRHFSHPAYKRHSSKEGNAQAVAWRHMREKFQGCQFSYKPYAQCWRYRHRNWHWGGACAWPLNLKLFPSLNKWE